ncbi:hypothetical protein B0H17DRAFT_1131254 [Mycena rosella]|uniref:Uncharacterized protein n=1 Tax=Mycena rosella TaxID=1033263 RepID=A0AAD7GL65_MYCRO|nr:hypothetical protein B0H17DRAFT_1131254 [Mycena rosella]
MPCTLCARESEHTFDAVWMRWLGLIRKGVQKDLGCNFGWKGQDWFILNGSSVCLQLLQKLLLLKYGSIECSKMRAKFCEVQVQCGSRDFGSKFDGGGGGGVYDGSFILLPIE